jgi:hypothetical protein
MKKTIMQHIIDYLDSGFTLTYGQANTITKSQSGYRRMQEILKENPEKYVFIKAKSKSGGVYNIFAKKGIFKVQKTVYKINDKYLWFVTNDKTKIVPRYILFCKTRKEALAQIKKVVR